MLLFALAGLLLMSFARRPSARHNRGRVNAVAAVAAPSPPPSGIFDDTFDATFQ